MPLWNDLPTRIYYLPPVKELGDQASTATLTIQGVGTTYLRFACKKAAKRLQKSCKICICRPMPVPCNGQAVGVREDTPVWKPSQPGRVVAFRGFILPGWGSHGHPRRGTNFVPRVSLAPNGVCSGMGSEDCREYKGFRGRAGGMPCLAQGSGGYHSDDIGPIERYRARLGYLLKALDCSFDID